MTNNFVNLGIDEEIIKILKKEGINNPTPIQEQTIPHVLRGKDVISQAQTGTGKTLAFLLPIMNKIDTNKKNVQALVITPTRELAIQITAEARKFGEAKGVNVLAAYGGQDVERQVRKLGGGIHIVIGTPGRLMDHLRRKSIGFGHLETLVLDEADQMLHMGFLNDVEDIIVQTKKTRQTLFFSATMPTEIRKLAKRYMNNPVQIEAKTKSITLSEIEQFVVETTDRRKQDALCDVIEEVKPFSAIIFCRTKRRVSELYDDLATRGYNCSELHGDLSQVKREKVMNDFRKFKTQYLIATDVAARGLDIEGITHIFNYDIAEDAESYIHRIGRTGRAGQTGVAYTFVAPKDRLQLNSIERGIQMTLKRKKVENSRDLDSMTENKPKERKSNEFKSKEYKPRDNKSRGNSFGKKGSEDSKFAGGKKRFGNSRGR